MIATWLSGKPSKEIYELQQAIDFLNKHLESLKQSEKDCLEQAAIHLEKAKEHCRENNKVDALHCLRKKRRHERTAQSSRFLQLPVHEQLASMKKMLTEALQDKDHTTKKITHVFIYFSLLLLILAYFVSYVYLSS